MNSGRNPLMRYGTVKVTTCSPGQLLLMLYDALFRFLGEAGAAIEAKDHTRSAERISRSITILEQLVTGLNREVSPTLCDTLAPLYAFCMRHVLQAKLRQDPAPLAEVMRILAPLRQAWVTAVTQVDRAASQAQATAAESSAAAAGQV